MHQSNDMPLTKQRPPRKVGGDIKTRRGFSQVRLDRLCDSMQPLMTRHVTEAEMERIFGEAEKCVFGPGGKALNESERKGKRGRVLGWLTGRPGWVRKVRG